MASFMNHIRTHLWLRCAIFFVAVLALRVAWCRWVPSDDPEGSNLLVNIVFAAVPTAIFALIDHYLLRRLWRQ